MTLNLDQYFTKTSRKTYEKWLTSQKLPKSTIDRKLSSLHRFDNWFENAYLKKNKPETYKSVSESVKFSAPQKGSVLKGSWISKRTDPVGKRLLSYLYLSLLVLFSVALGIYGYRQIFKEAIVSQANPQPSLPQPPNRLLSFQARLTDSSDNPIDSPTDFRFLIYNADAPASGSAKLWEEQRYIDPDQDGIFSVTLGTETAIPTTLFTENADLWLGVTVETDPEAHPRQRIATVAYALNSETLQGLPLGTGTTAPFVPYFDATGKLTVATANPQIYSSSGTFSIKGQILTLTTDTGDGDIQIAPDGTGNLDINLSSTIQNALDITNANQTSGHLISGWLGNNTATGDLLNLSAGSTAVERFTVDTGGNTYIAGNLGIGTTNPTQKLDVSGNVNIGGTAIMTGFKLTTSPTNNYVLTSDTNGVGTWQAAAGGISGSGTQYYLPIWTSSSALGNSSIYETGANVGIGTTNPLQKLQVAGDINVETGSGYMINNTAASGNYLRGDGTRFVSNTIQVGDLPAITTAGGWTDGGSSVYLTTSADNVGIGTSTPLVKLHVVGDGTNAASFMSGNVGIGLTNPGYALDVNGSVNIGMTAFIGTIPLVVDNNRVLTSASAGSGAIQYLDTTAWDKDSADDYSAWLLKGDSGTPESVGTGNTAWIAGDGLALTTAVSATDKLTITHSTANGYVHLPSDGASAQLLQYSSAGTGKWISLSGDVTIADAGATAIGNDKVTEAMLKAVNAAVDEDILTYETTTGDFEWHTPTEMGLTNYWARNTTFGSIFPSTLTDNVGIGLTNPLQKLDLVAGSSYGIGSTAVLSATTLGVGVTASSLTKVGILNDGSIASGFGAIDTGADNIITTGTMGVAANTLFTGLSQTLSGQFTSTAIGGTAPFVLASTTLNTNLNADLLDGSHAAAFCNADGSNCTTTIGGGWTDGGSSVYLTTSTDNVGIGTSTPLVKLHVVGDGTNAASFMSGNVGIGTTNPLQKLHVEGQCITGDSLLSLADGSTQRIDQVKGGEQVLSLNETTGKLEPQKIKGLLDMGVKPVYKLTTEDGKTIRTTGNHPYLVKFSSLLSQTKESQITSYSNQDKSNDNQINIGLHNLPSFFVNKIKNNQNQATDNSGEKIGISNIPFNHNFTSLANFNETIKKNPANINETTNVIIKSKIDLGRANKGEIAPAENQATAILPAISDALPSWPTDNLPIKNNYNTVDKENVKMLALSETKWTKVIYLKIGDEIAVANFSSNGSRMDSSEVKFEKIKSIEKLPAEQIWDIEVENTHNFVANGIIAHNTYINGNVGIGTTNPLEKLQVSGDINVETGSGYMINNTAALGQYLRGDATRFVSSTIQLGDLPSISTAGGWTDGGSSVYLTTSADNVGIGTSSPASGSKLHVEGQCVEENSLITTNIGSKPIKDIQSGDQVLSLNETTGEFEYQTVEKTLDMGTKEIYELTTETGKKIETTGNHPYLARSLFKESQIDQKTGDQHQSKSDLRPNININQPIVESLFHSLSSHNNFLNLKAITRENIPAIKLTVNIQRLNFLGILENGEKTTATANQATDKLINQSENTVNQTGSIFINPNISQQWTKVIYLKEGDEIATTDGFETIASIKVLPPKHVYDLQIANTHNFVANGIIAHNTYISGNVGIGTSTPLVKLHVVGDGTNTAAFMNGNVGIGTTAPLQTLDLVSGSAYGIGGASVLNATTLGVGVTASSLTKVGILNDGSIAAGFGAIDTGADNIITTGTMGVAANALFTGLSLTATGQITSSYANSAALNLTGDASGITFTGTGINQIITGGTNHLALMPGGNVGIGTTTPLEKLDIAGNIKLLNSGGTGEIYTTSTNLDKTWTATADFNTTGTAFSSGMKNPATNDELKLDNPAVSPFLYVFANGQYTFLSDFIGKATAKEKEYTSYANITDKVEIVGGKIKLKITEELDETAFIDKVFLRIDGDDNQILELSSITNADKNLLLSSDNQYLIMEKGSEYYLEFPAPEKYNKLEFAAEGYFVDINSNQPPEEIISTNNDNDDNSTLFSKLAAWVKSLFGHDKTESKESKPTNTSWVKDFLATHPGYKEEDVVKRTENSIHFKRPDGKIEAELAQSPINYKNDQGQWETLDTAITPSNDSQYDYQNTTNSFKTFFSSNAYQDEGNIKLVKGDATLTIKTIDTLTFTDRNETYTLSDLSPKTEEERQEKKGVVDQQEQNKICYPKLYEKQGKTIDVCYIVKEGRIQEQLILNEYQGFPELTQTITLHNAYAKKEGKQITFYHTQTDELLWYILDPVIYEQNEREDPQTKMPTKFENRDLHYDLICNQANTPLGKCSDLSITKILEPKAKEYLSDPQRQYPVVIDPDFADSTSDGYIEGIGATYADSRLTSTGYNLTYFLNVGALTTYPYNKRSFLVFNTSTIPDDSAITQVNLKMVSVYDYSNNDFDLQIIKYNWSAWEADPTNETKRETAYDGCLAGTADDNIWRNTNGMNVNTQYTSGNLNTAWVSKTGNTYYCLLSSLDKNNNAPAGRSEIYLESQEALLDVAYRPILTVVYTMLPTNDSLTFTNPYGGSGNDAVADNTTEWNFRAVVSDGDGYANLSTVVLRLANSSDNATPFDALKFTWTESTDTFSETADTQTAATITSTNADSTCATNTCTLDFKIKFNNNFSTVSTNYTAELYTTDDDTNTDQDSYAAFYQVKLYFASGEQTWTSETQDSGAGNTYKPNKLTATWALDGTDNTAPKFQVMGSSTGSFAGEETIYPAGTGTYYQDGGTYDINSGVELDISSQVTNAYRYWKVKAYINTGTDGTDTPKIYDIRLRDYHPLTLQASGQSVGIGTTGPGSALDVKGTLRLSGSTSGYVGLAPAAAAGSTTYTLPSADGTSGQVLSTSGAGVLSWTTGGSGGSSVWSALTAPTANLSLNMATYTSTFTYNASTGTNNLFNLTDTLNNTGTGYLLNLTTASGSTLKPFHVSSAGTEALTVIANGNVGIGTTDPAQKLDVVGTIQMTGFNLTTTPTNGYVLTSDVNGVGTWQEAAGGGGWTDGGSSVYLTTSADNVGIGTSTPLVKLHVVGDGVNAAAFMSGNVGIGNTSPGYALGITGSVNLTTGNAYYINGTSVLNTNTLGTGILTSSLTTVGVLGAGSIASGFGAIDTGADNIITTGTMGVANTTTFTGNDLTLDSQFTSSYANAAAINLTGAGAGITFTNTGPNRIVTAASQHLALMPGANVGIGTTAPSNLLDLYKNGSVAIRIRAESSGGEGYYARLILDGDATGGGDSAVYIYDGGVNQGVFGTAGNGLVIQTSSALPITFTTNNVDRLGIGATGGISIGSTYYSTDPGAGNMIIQGNVGIGTTAPGAKLDVAGQVNIGSNAKLNFSGGNPLIDSIFDDFSLSANTDDSGTGKFHFKTNSTTEAMTISGGNVGIGTTGPGVLLDISTVAITGDKTIRINTEATTGYRSILDLGGVSNHHFLVYGDSSNDSFHITTATTNQTVGSDRLTILSTGNVGIGTTSPVAKLSLGNGVNSLPTNTKLWVEGAGSGPSSTIQSRIGLGADNNLDYGAYLGEINIDGSTGQILQLGTRVGGVDSPGLNIRYGNVGIGTTDPLQKLDVAGTIQMTGFKLTTSPTNNYILTSDVNGVGTWQAATGGASGWTDGGASVYLTTTADNVGIGTSTPLVKLHVVGDGVNAAAFMSGNVGIGTTNPTTALYVNGIVTADSFYDAQNASYYLNPASTGNSLLVAGNVGIGTTNPGAALEVNGQVKITGGSPDTGKYLMSDADGLASWAGVSALEKDFTAGANVTAGDVVSIAPSGQVTKGVTPAMTAYTPRVAKLDSTHFVVVFADTYYLYAVVCSVSGTTITCGNPSNSGTTINLGSLAYVAALDSTHFVIAFKDYVTNYGKAIIGATDGGTTISSWGSASTYSTGNQQGISVASLDSTHFVVLFSDYSGYLAEAIVALTSGTAISSWGSAVALNSGTLNNVSSFLDVAMLDSTHFVGAYDDRTTEGAGYGKAAVCVTSGTTISSCGSQSTFFSASLALTPSVATLTGTDPYKFVVAHRDASGYGSAKIASATGTTISSWGSASVFNSADTTYLSVGVLDSTHFVATYRDQGNSFYGTGIIGLTDGSTTISSWGSENVFFSGSSYWNEVASLDSTHFASINLNTSSLAMTRVGLTSGTTISSYSTNYPLTGTKPYIGIAKQTKTAGQTVTVITAGISSVHSGLIPGFVYYANTSGDLSTTASTYRIGIAANSTSLILSSNRDNTNQFFGDLVFANDFRITEDWGNPQGLIFKNQLGQAILTLSENGDLKISGQLTEMNSTDSGDLSISLATQSADTATPSAPSTTLGTGSLRASPPATLAYRLIKESTQEAINRIGAFAEVVVAKLRAGLIETQELIADTLTITNKILAPTVETEVLTTNFISPLADGEITITGPVVIEADATISGTLYADKIQSSTIDIMRQKIEELVAGLNQPTATPPDSDTIDVNTLNTLYELLNAKNEATASAQSLDIASVEADFGFFKDYLAVLGQAVITDLTVTNTLSTASITSPTGSLSLLAGLMVLDQSGNVAINGNLTVNGSILAQKITAPQGHFEELLAQKLEVDEAKIKSLTTDSLIIAGDASASAQTATSSASITTNATAGKAILPAGSAELTINSPHITAETLIYVTPIGDSQNQVLYVKAKEVSAWFKVAVNQPLDHDLEFNWWIIKLE